MRNPDAIFDAISTPVYAGAAIALLLTMRQVEKWRARRGAAPKQKRVLNARPAVV